MKTLNWYVFTGDPSSGKSTYTHESRNRNRGMKITYI